MAKKWKTNKQLKMPKAQYYKSSALLSATETQTICIEMTKPFGMFALW